MPWLTPIWILCLGASVAPAWSAFTTRKKINSIPWQPIRYEIVSVPEGKGSLIDQVEIKIKFNNPFSHEDETHSAFVYWSTRSQYSVGDKGSGFFKPGERPSLNSATRDYDAEANNELKIMAVLLPIGIILLAITWFTGNFMKFPKNF